MNAHNFETKVSANLYYMPGAHMFVAYHCPTKPADTQEESPGIYFPRAVGDLKEAMWALFHCAFWER